MRLDAELKHLFGNDIYNAAKASMKTKLNSKMLHLLLDHTKRMRELSGKPTDQREYVNDLPNDEKIALCRLLIR